jgi:hypothetical protein
MQLFKDLTRPIRRRIAASNYSFPQGGPTFSHVDAQRYELEHNAATIRENHERQIAEWNAEKSRGGLWQNKDNGSKEIPDAAKLRSSSGIAVRSRSVRALCYLAPVIDRRSRDLDPLAREYRSRQIAINGQTFFTMIFESTPGRRRS